MAMCKNVCNYIPVKPGEIYIIPPGLVHSLGAGIVLLEIQQNSDCTYRLYDYDRLDHNGHLRRIDKDKALKVVNFNNFKPSYPLLPKAGERIVDSEFFKIDSHLNQTDRTFFNDGSRFYILTNLEGQAELQFEGGCLRWSSGESIFLPAALPRVTIKGTVSYLQTYLP